MKHSIVWDFDETTAPTFEAHLHWHNQRTGAAFSYGNAKTFDISRSFPFSRAEAVASFQEFFENDACRDLPLYQEAPTLLRSLASQGIRNITISGRDALFCKARNRGLTITSAMQYNLCTSSDT